MSRFLASWFGSGLILGRVRGSDEGSGTVGALVAFPISLLVGEWFGWQGQLIAIGAVLASGWWATARLASEGDAGWIVIDEAAGAMIATFGLGLWPAVVGFIVFRAADIFKRWFPGVSQAERLPGAYGVMADDVVAGVYGLIIGHIVRMAFF